MTVEMEMMNEENGRLRRHIKTLEAELRKQDAAQAQAAPIQDVHAEVVASHIQNIRCVKPLECPKCHALWLFWPKEQSGFATDTLSVKSATHCNYCENARADQLIPLDRVQAAQGLTTVQTADCGCIGPRDCTGECCKKAAVEPVNQLPMKAADEFELRRLLEEERYTVRQLSRALRDATEGPTFMGEPVLQPKQSAAPGDIRALKYRIHELEGEVIGYKRILDGQGKAEPVAIAHVGNMDHGPFEVTPTAHGCDHLKHGDKLYTQATVEPVKDLNDLLVGMLVSMDVSTGEHDAYHRVFGTVCEVMLQSCGAAEDTILAIEDSRNFQDAVEPVAADKLLAITTAYEQGVGKGMKRNDFNPYGKDTDEGRAWRLGYEEGLEKAAVEPVAYIRRDQLQKARMQAMLCEVTPEARQDRVAIYTSPPDHREAMWLALEALSNSVDLVWEEYTEAERSYGNYPTRRAKLDGMKAMAQQHTDAIAALEGVLR